ncbi:hypothetical protein [Vibrio panuliri]|uniref:Acid phosphatase n=1 Tax=Vibrio panuliri TaxID=1381081 RepID=A0ABX3FK87_9VIBR|nr:hypothetical protein [Vibrio panuliri]KAB1460421.1 hypothetical protein F7O85_01300 [Vibrio panuliri]OLQ92249.1 hypothetical protein BIY20_08775 [Vibrio panuliri]
MNKKLTLLATSVALALAGCGGSDGSADKTAQADSVVITGFDGYFKNAVVFEDRTPNGKLDTDEQIFGFTDSKGNLAINKADLPQNAVLALQTIIPGGNVQKALIARDPVMFSGQFTTDMDHPTQAMSHEVVLRTLPGESIISPLTDLVVVQAGANPTPQAIEAAKDKVNEKLGIEGDTAFSDVIASQNHALHKTAQILTESKAKAGDKYDANTAMTIAQEATEIVNKPENKELLDKPDFKPSVEVSSDGSATVKVNNKLEINSSVVDAIKLSLEPVLESHDIQLTIDLSAEENGKNVMLFSDKDNNLINVTAEIIDIPTNAIIMTARVDNGGQLVLNGDLTENGKFAKRQSYMLKVSADDLDTEKTSVGAVASIFTLRVELPNTAPQVVSQQQALLQDWIGSIELFANVDVDAHEKMSIADLFIDEEQTNLQYYAKTSVSGLKAVINEQNELVISGKPNKEYAGGETITITAFDGIEYAEQEFTLAAIEKAPLPSFSVDTQALSKLQSEINSQLGQLKVNQPIGSVQFETTLASIFPAHNPHGPIEYFAGLKGSDSNGQTSIPGLMVNVDDSTGTLTISGTPTQAVNNGDFYVAAGITPDAVDGITSEMKRITLPNVQGDETTAPVELSFTEEHFNNQLWKMGSFARNDGEIAYAMLRNLNGTLAICWGLDFEEGSSQDPYKTNISHQGSDKILSILQNLDNQSDYDKQENKDCWDVTINPNGTLTEVTASEDGHRYSYQMLYQNKITSGETPQYQIILKTDDELFWLDSTDTPFAEVGAIENKVTLGAKEYELGVESHRFGDDTILSYTSGEYHYTSEDQYSFTSIAPEGLYTLGSWLVEDNNGYSKLKVVEAAGDPELGTESDEKTRYRYVQRDFGDFYIGINWDIAKSSNSANIQYALYSDKAESMKQITDNLPIAED